MTELVWLIPAFPLLGFLIILVGGRRLGEPAAGLLATAMVGLSFVVSAAIYFDLLGMDESERSHTETLFSWVPVGDLSIDMAFLVDPLSITMCLFVTGVGALIHLYSILPHRAARGLCLDRQPTSKRLMAGLWDTPYLDGLTTLQISSSDIRPVDLEIITTREAFRNLRHISIRSSHL
ncbi:MAG: hypothetical protein AAF945_02790, partial [Actinomycetota bacterium]